MKMTSETKITHKYLWNGAHQQTVIPASGNAANPFGETDREENRASMTRVIELTQDQVALVDDWRYEEFSQWEWCAQWSENAKSFYAVRNEGKWPFQRKIFMHRQIMNTPRRMRCDHINHNTLDNQEYNLRNVTNSQNGMNRRVQFSNQLGQKGISPHGKGYRVRVIKDDEVVFYKTFRTLDEAIVARDTALSQFHGEYACRGER